MITSFDLVINCKLRSSKAKIARTIDRGRLNVNPYRLEAQPQAG